MLENKCASIFRVGIMQTTSARIEHLLGNPTVRVSGAWNLLKFSEIEFSEKESETAGFWEVELKIKVTDTSQDETAKLKQLCGCYVLALLKYTDGTSRVVGTDEAPVVLSLSKTGNPAFYELVYKGNQPEQSKLLQSF